MSKNVLLVVESVSNELDVSSETIFKAIEIALASLVAKRFEEVVDIRVSVDHDTGDHEAFRRWVVVAEDELAHPAKELTLTQAKEIDESLESGDFVEEQVEAEVFDRIGAHQAKQVIGRIVREASRAKLARHYESRVGELFNGQIKRVSRDGITVEVGSEVEGYVPRDHVILRESLRVGDHIRACLYAVNAEGKGPLLLLSRTCPEMLAKLFEIQVPEIREHVITIEAIARDPGVRAKIAVKTNDGRIDPIGACLGMRCSRVQAVSSELNNERVEVILWDGDPAQFVINALVPAEVSYILVDEQAYEMDVAVAEEQLSKAIGRNGQNVNLASRLTGWTLNIMSEEEASEENEKHLVLAKDRLVEKLDLDENVAILLAQAGFNSVEDVAYVALEDLLAIEGFDEDIVTELRERANTVLLEDAVKPESRGETTVTDHNIDRQEDDK